jgi:molybdopterin synthase sulfur carrier subunit
MRVRALYFAAVRDLVGAPEEALELPASVRSIGAFAVFIAARNPALADRLGAVRFARNETFADASDAIDEGDVIALIPPVAGG